MHVVIKFNDGMEVKFDNFDALSVEDEISRNFMSELKAVKENNKTITLIGSEGNLIREGKDLKSIEFLLD